MAVTRWEGSPTSGRYVYRLRCGHWYWQCDLHDEVTDDDGTYGHGDTMPDAFTKALEHATKCGLTNA